MIVRQVCLVGWLTVSAATQTQEFPPPDVVSQVNVDALQQNIVGEVGNEPTIAVDPTNTSRIAVGWRQFPNNLSSSARGGFAYSDDGGKTWQYPGILSTISFDPACRSLTDPVMAWNAQGAFFYQALALDCEWQGIPAFHYRNTVYRSDDGGATWQAPNLISALWGDGWDKPWYAIDRAALTKPHYCIGGNYDIHFTRSFDDGMTWSQSVTMDRQPGDGARIGSHIDYASNGQLMIGYWDFTNNMIGVFGSTDASNPATTPVFRHVADLDFGLLPAFGNAIPVNAQGSSSMVSVGIDRSGGPQDGWAYVLASAIPATDPCDVMFSRSTDQGQTWSSPARVNSDGPGGYNYLATMSLAPDGRIDALWYDTRNDPANNLSQLFYAFSTNGGLTWVCERTLTEPFDPQLAILQNGRQFIGDYIHSVSHDNHVDVVLTATFNGEPDIYFVRAFAGCVQQR